MESNADVKRYELLIDGEAVAAEQRRVFAHHQSGHREPIALVAQGTAADVDRAVQAARAALKPWNAIRAASAAAS